MSDLYLLGCAGSQLQHVGSSVFIAACGTLSYSTWGLLPQPRIELGPPALGVWSLSHRTTYIQGSPYIYKLYMYFYQSSFFLHIFFYHFFLHIIFILSLQTCLSSYTCIGYTTYLRNQPLLESQYFLSFTVMNNCVIKALVCICWPQPHRSLINPQKSNDQVNVWLFESSGDTHCQLAFWKGSAHPQSPQRCIYFSGSWLL